eukprot:TRINITY_DN16573_c0_g2_i1.p1 TRINITY_DN16573_c0_g2~~TRINITY_DN16573_c0_g2_i1.p1  ORF type:complete len:352 (+),score=62.52 TRINITY_DN16573_c0_g2_i1:69-1124(+)
MSRWISTLLAGVAMAREAVLDCTNGITCKAVEASGFSFDCRFGGEGKTAGNVVLLHGFPEWASMFDDTMRTLASQGYASMACDQRGYSPGASPTTVESYHYDLLRDDVFAVAEAVGFKTFHLVGHDHGGALGWVVAGSHAAAGKVLSYSSLSTPHMDAFSKALYGPDVDEQQQCASQYFTMFVEKDSATSHFDFWCRMFKGGRITDCDQVQRKLYWYNGAMAAGYMASPPILSSLSMIGKGCFKAAGLRAAWGSGNGDAKQNGIPQTTPVGEISVPSLFVCGSSDDALLCSRPYARASGNYTSAGYTYVEVDCGHGLLSCHEPSQTQMVIDSIVQHVKSASAKSAGAMLLM